MKFNVLMKSNLYLIKDKELVYGIFRNNKYIYIGKTTKGVSRILSHTHSLHWLRGGILNTDLIHIWTEIDIHLFEIEMIKLHKPQWNKIFNK